MKDSRSMMTNQQVLDQTSQKLHASQVDDDLRKAGADVYDFLLPETHALADIIRMDERILGIVYGHYKQIVQANAGTGALIATTNHVLLLDKKPMFARADELGYNVISGVSYTRAGFAGTVTLHTRAGDITVRTLNQKCARNFVSAIEKMLFTYGPQTQPGRPDASLDSF